jgi:hypothetical protein
VDARELVERLGLQPLPLEGGYYRETYRSDVPLPGRTGRAISTAIYYLLTPETFSAMHRLASDEIFHFYAGDPVEMLQLHPDGSHEIILIGNDIEAGQRPQVVVVRGVWQGCRIADLAPALSCEERGRVGYALMGTTVAPGFEPEDYEHGDRSALAAQYPQCAEMIKGLTRVIEGNVDVY